MNKINEKNKKSTLLISIIVVGGLILLLTKVFPSICNSYEKHWYQEISDEKMIGVSYSSIVAMKGAPMYKMPATSNSEVCVFSPYYRFGFVGRLISRLRGQPQTAIAFVDGNYWAVFQKLGSGETTGTGLLHEPSLK